MLTARVMNDTLKARKTQGKFPFYIGCAGHESMAAVVAALDDEDWLSFYYRDLAGWLQRTDDVHGVLRAAYSRVTDPMCSGRNMPSHYSSREHHILPTFSEVSGLAPFAGGVGWAFKRDGTRRVVMFSTGDGGAATNDFNVLLRQATVHKLPVLITVWNNHWAIMTEQQAQWAGDLTAQVRAMDAIAVDVNAVDPFEVYETAKSLTERLRAGEGPAFMHLHGGLLDAALQQHRHPPLPHARGDRGDGAHKGPRQAYGRDAGRARATRAGRDRAHARRDQGAHRRRRGRGAHRARDSRRAASLSA